MGRRLSLTGDLPLSGEGARGEAKGLTPAKQKEKITELYTLYKVLDRRTLYRLTAEL